MQHIEDSPIEVSEKRAHDREESDSNLAILRANMDSQRQTKREGETLLRKSERLDDLIFQERRSADAAVHRERRDNDKVYQTASTLLEHEVESHAVTKAALTTREEFLAIVSHDLRNPIGAVLSCTDMLLDEYGDMSKDDLKTWLCLIQRNAQTALKLIGDLLDMERVAEGRLVLQIGEHDLNNIVKKSVENFIHLAAAKSIVVRAKSAPRPLMASCDRERVEQVLSNLIGNALKFTPEGGSISVEASGGSGTFTVSVSDTGCGIAGDQLEHVFGRFTQLGKHDRRGLGLGLFISKTMIEAQGGTLTVQSAVGKGSVFTIALPTAGK